MNSELVEPPLGSHPRGFSSMPSPFVPGTGIRVTDPSPSEAGILPDGGSSSTGIICRLTTDVRGHSTCLPEGEPTEGTVENGEPWSGPCTREKPGPLPPAGAPRRTQP